MGDCRTWPVDVEALTTFECANDGWPDDATSGEPADDAAALLDRAVRALLQRQVANALVLYLGYQRCRWSVSGARFRELRALGAEHAAAILATIDEIAERVRMLGELPPATLTAIRAFATVREADGPPDSPDAMLQWLLAQHQQVLAELRDGVVLADSAVDPGSADLLARLVRLHEHQAWVLRETADGPGGTA